MGATGGRVDLSPSKPQSVLEPVLPLSGRGGWGGWVDGSLLAPAARAPWLRARVRCVVLFRSGLKVRSLQPAAQVIDLGRSVNFRERTSTKFGQNHRRKIVKARQGGTSLAFREGR